MVLISNKESAHIPVRDQSYIGTARRAAREFAQELGLSGEPLEKLSILVSEMASNLAKHADNGGEILIYDASCLESKAVRLFSVDKGPGITDIDNVLIDGVSSTNTLGAGLGSLKRLSDCFEIGSSKNGTVLVCSIFQTPPARKTSKSQDRLSLGYVSVPHPGETHCGDAVSIASSAEISSLLVVDGLGHGVEAADVSERAARTFQESPFEDPLSILSRIHQSVLGSRGAALALAQIIHAADKLLFAGVGNISCNIYMPYTSKGCASTQGIVGGQIGNLKQFEYEWGANAVLLMYSDGIKSAAQLDCSSPKSANLLAAEIYRDYSRHNDDATVVVAKDNRSN